MKILIVHRQKEVIGQIESVLPFKESNIRFSDSGLDGLLAARIENFDLIICSTDLPVITGFEMIRSVRTNSINKATPVIFLSSQINDSIKYLASSLGVLALFTERDVDTKLADLVKEKVPDTTQKDLLDLLPTQLN